jgi:hypothetical protein
MSDSQREDVLATVRRHFPEAEVPAVMEMLDRYGTQANEPERDRVHLAILKLSEGQRSKLQHYVDAAKCDHRDVLHWSEGPGLPASSVLDVLRASWSWVLSGALRVLAQNSFGNVLVELGDGSIWRVCPEDLDISKVAESEGGLAERWADPEFQADWTVESWVEAAESALGRLEEGQCYGFKIWPVLGGTYEVENMAIKSMLEWLAVSGDAARQIKDLPPGAQVRLDIRDA